MTKKHKEYSEVNEENITRKFTKLAEKARLRGFTKKGGSPSKAHQTPKLPKEPPRTSPRNHSRKHKGPETKELRQKGKNDLVPRRLVLTDDRPPKAKKKHLPQPVEIEEESEYEASAESSSEEEESEGVSETQFTTPNAATGEERSPVSTPSEKHKLEIRVYRDSFQPDVTKDINKIIISCWRGPFINWNQKQFQWAPNLESEVNKLFKKKCANKIRNFITRCKVNLKKPPHVNIEDWEFMNERCKYQKYVDKCNRVSELRSKFVEAGGSTYCGGSTSAHEHRRKLETELKRPASLIEVFNSTHQKKGGGYSGTRAERVAAKFEELKRAQEEAGDDCLDRKTDEELWVQATGGPINGRVFGIDFVGRGNNYNVESQCSEILRLKELVEQRDNLILQLEEHARQMSTHKIVNDNRLEFMNETLNGVLSHLNLPTRTLPADLASQAPPIATAGPVPAILPLNESEETQP